MMGSLNLTNASFASTAVTPSRAKTPMGDGNGNGNGVTFADDLPDLGSPDVDDVNPRLGGFSSDDDGFLELVDVDERMCAKYHARVHL